MDFQKASSATDSHLWSLSSDSLSVNTKIALLSIHNQKQFKVLETILMIFEYLQLMSQVLFLYLDSNNQAFSDTFLALPVIGVFKLLNPGYLLEFDEQNGIVEGVIAATLIFTLLKYIIFGYIVLLATRPGESDSLVIPVWKIIFTCQGRIIYFFITSFWLSTALDSLQGNTDIFGLGRVGVSVSLVALIVLEYIFSLFLNITYHSILPNKSFLSSKNPSTQILTLTQKFSIQLLQVILVSFPNVNYWVFGSVNVIFSLTRNVRFFRTLPFYRAHALFCLGYLLMVITALDLACFAQDIEKLIGDDENLEFIILIWILLSILMMFICHNYLLKLFAQIVTTSTMLNPYLLIHKVCSIKQLRNHANLPTEFNYKYGHQYLMTMTINANSKDIINTDKHLIDIRDLNTKEVLDKSVLVYLESLQKKFPRNGLIKLYIAKFAASKLKLYGAALRLLSEIQSSAARTIRLNASILIWEIQRSIRSDLKNHHKNIDLHAYFTVQGKFDEIKGKVVKQAELQADLYQEILSDSPNLAKMFDHGQMISIHRREIERKINILTRDMPDWNLQPYFLGASYHMALNYSPTNANKFSRIYRQKYHKYEKYIQSSGLVTQNLYQEDNAFVIVSGIKEDMGRIVYCSNSIKNIFGGDVNFYRDMNISNLTCLNFKDICSMFFSSNPTKSTDIPIKQIFRGYSLHKEGYLLELDFYLDLFPFLTQGLYFCIIIRPIFSSKEYMLVQENGHIEGASKGLSRKLGINKSLRSVLNIKQISEELLDLNNALNQLTFFEDYSVKSIEEFKQNSVKWQRNNILLKPKLMEHHPASDISRAMELYSIYANQGRDIEINPIIKIGDEISSLKETSFTYNCKVKIICHKSAIMKLLTFQEIIKEDGTNQTLESPIQQKNVYFSLIKLQKVLEPSPETILSEENLLNEENLTEKFGDESPIHSPGMSKINSVFNNKTGEITKFLKTDTEGQFHPSLIDEKAQQTKPTVTLMDASPKTVKTFQKTNSTQGHFKAETFQKYGRIEFRSTEISIASPSSATSHRRRFLNSIDDALTCKYYPKSIILFCLLFYSLFIAVVGIQIANRISFDTTIDDLKAKKELLRNAQARDSSLEETHRTFRMMWDSWTGVLNSSDLGAFSSTTTSDFINAANRNLLKLTQVNQQIMIDIKQVDNEAKDVLFQPNIGLVYVNSAGKQQSVLNLTSYQATNQVIEAGIRVIKMIENNQTDNTEALQFVFLNSANDLLLKTQATSALFYQSIRNTIDQRKVLTNVYMVVRIILLVLTFCLFAGLTLRKYHQENTRLQALIRVDIQEIKTLREQVIAFSKGLTTASVQALNNSVKDLDIHQQRGKGKSLSFKHHIKTPNDKGIFQKYLFYIGKAFAIFAIIISFITWISVSENNSDEYLKTEQARLYFADNMIITVNMAFLASQELFATNNTAYIQRVSAKSQLRSTITNLNTLRNNADETLSGENGDHDSIVESVLFDDACQLLGNSSTNYCSFLQNKALKTSLILLLSTYEELMNEKLEAFQVSNRTEESLYIARTEDFDEILALQKVLEDESSLIAARINSNFEVKFTDLGNQRDIISDVFYVIVIILAFLSWIFIFQEVMNSDNKFKTVLRTFPTDIVISNFVLKSFLLETSDKSLSAKKMTL